MNEIILILGIIIVIIDFFYSGVIFPIGVGLIIYAVLMMLTNNFIISSIAFVLSVITIYYFILTFVIKKNVVKGTVRIDDILGMGKRIGRVIKRTKDGLYIIKVNGDEWLAESDEELKEGEKVKIVEIGVKLKVTRYA